MRRILLFLWRLPSQQIHQFSQAYSRSGSTVVGTKLLLQEHKRGPRYKEWCVIVVSFPEEISTAAAIQTRNSAGSFNYNDRRGKSDTTSSRPPHRETRSVKGGLMCRGNRNSSKVIALVNTSWHRTQTLPTTYLPTNQPTYLTAYLPT
jgi:hypothetical protein